MSVRESKFGIMKPSLARVGQRHRKVCMQVRVLPLNFESDKGNS